MRQILIFFFLLSLLSCSKKDSVQTEATLSTVYEKAKKLLPVENLGEVRYIKEADIFEVETKGLPYYLYFFGNEGKYFVYGDLNLMANDTPINLSAEIRTQKNSVVLDEFQELPDDKFLAVFKANKNTGKTLYVFADLFCSYCKMFHKTIPELNQNGITVKYLGFPFLKENSKEALISVYCADNREQAFTKVIETGSFTSKICANPIGNHIEYARQMVVQGTPFIVFSNGKVKPGYVSVEEILKTFE